MCAEKSYQQPTDASSVTGNTGRSVYRVLRGPSPVVYLMRILLNLVLILLSVPALALYDKKTTSQVPVNQLIKKLSEDIKFSKDPPHQLSQKKSNLARLYAMRYSTGAEAAPAEKTWEGGFEVDFLSWLG